MDFQEIKLFHIYTVCLYDWNGFLKPRPVLVAALKNNNVLCFKITSQYFNKDYKLQVNYCPLADWRIEHLRKPSYADMNSAIWISKSAFKSSYNFFDVGILSRWDTKVMLTAALQYC